MCWFGDVCGDVGVVVEDIMVEYCVLVVFLVVG